MKNRFMNEIGPFVQAELDLADQARNSGRADVEFQHLENAHVLGQESTRWHVKVHVQMLLWALRNSKPRETAGQLFRIVGAATKTAFGLVPKGNTGGSNVSPFKTMPISPAQQSIIDKAKGNI